MPKICEGSSMDQLLKMLQTYNLTRCTNFNIIITIIEIKSYYLYLLNYVDMLDLNFVVVAWSMTYLPKYTTKKPQLCLHNKMSDCLGQTRLGHRPLSDNPTYFYP